MYLYSHIGDNVPFKFGGKECPFVYTLCFFKKIKIKKKLKKKKTKKKRETFFMLENPHQEKLCT
jgi:hypothetical protein